VHPLLDQLEYTQKLQHETKLTIKILPNKKKN
jgi:hypothetical protein